MSSFLIEEKSIWRISISRRALFSGAIIGTKVVYQAFPNLSELSPLARLAVSNCVFRVLIRIRRWRGTSRRSVGLPFSNPLQVACGLARSAQAYLKAIHTRAGAGVPNSVGDNGGGGGGGFYWFWHTLPLSKASRSRKRPRSLRKFESESRVPDEIIERH